MTKQYTLEDLQGIVESSAWLNEHEAKWLLDYAESLEKRNADQAQLIAGILQDKASLTLCKQASQPHEIHNQSLEGAALAFEHDYGDECTGFNGWKAAAYLRGLKD